MVCCRCRVPPGPATFAVGRTALGTSFIVTQASNKRGSQQELAVSLDSSERFAWDNQSLPALQFVMASWHLLAKSLPLWRAGIMLRDRNTSSTPGQECCWVATLVPYALPLERVPYHSASQGSLRTLNRSASTQRNLAAQPWPSIRCPIATCKRHSPRETKDA